MIAPWTDLGLIAYQEAYTIQTQLVERCREDRNQSYFLILEHKPVYTLGRRGGQENLKVPLDFLSQKGIDLVPIERGGDITYHGPGQIILYPIFCLRHFQLSVGDYVHLLEEIMLRTADDCGVTANRDSRNHGIWVGNHKLGSVGIAIRHGITFHGLGLNINTNLTPFHWINPCGLNQTSMTSCARVSGKSESIENVKNRIKKHCQELLGVTLSDTSRDELAITRSLSDVT